MRQLQTTISREQKIHHSDNFGSSEEVHEMRFPASFSSIFGLSQSDVLRRNDDVMTDFADQISFLNYANARM
jgi:hypothetical protein